MDGYGPGTYGERWADVYDDWYGGVSDVDGTVARIGDLAAGRRVLELGVGTGRLAIPLAANGADVTGLDASPEMLARLRAKPGGRDVKLVIGDMAAPPLRGPFGVAFAAFNTFFNLPTPEAQRRCVEQVASLLQPDGVLVVEGLLPGDELDAPAGDVAPRTIALDRVVLTVSRHEPHEQTITGQHVEITETGIRLRPWVVRYVRPEQLDALAAGAGLSLVERWGGWRREPFDPGGAGHVSVYGFSRGD